MPRWFRHRDLLVKAKDGDGDGMVNDGTPQERPVGPQDIGPSKKPKGTKGKTGGTKKVTYDPDAPLGSQLHPIKVRSAKKALELMAQGQHVELDPHTLAVSLDKLSVMARKAREQGTDAPDINLCLAHLSDTNIFCESNKGIPRIKMPQLKGKNIRPGSSAASKGMNKDGEVDSTDEFVAMLQGMGVEMHDEDRDAALLKATQTELVGAKVGGMMAASDAGKFDPSKGRIFISRDGFVLDGHHRWAATVGLSYRRGQKLSMPVTVIDLPIQELVTATTHFTEGFGIMGNAASATNKSAPVPCYGCGDDEAGLPVLTSGEWSNGTSTDSGRASTSVGKTSAGRGRGQGRRAGTDNSASTARSSTRTGSSSRSAEGSSPRVRKSSTAVTTQPAATQRTSPSEATQRTWPTRPASGERATTRQIGSGTGSSSTGSRQGSTPTTLPGSSGSPTAPASTGSSDASGVEKKKSEAWYNSHPNPKSSPKEIVGSHDHRAAGPSILWPALYRELRKKGMSKSKAAAISNGKWNQKHGVGAKNLKSTRVTKATISKLDDEKQNVFGWAYVAQDLDGTLVVDKSGDFIDELHELEDAAYEFVLESRQGGADHARHEDGPKVVSKMIESFVVTPEKAAAMGIPEGVLPVGAWWTGFHIDDAETWGEVKKGRYKMFSIHGSGVREAIEIEKRDGFDTMLVEGVRVARPARVRSMISTAELRQRKLAAQASARKRKGKKKHKKKDKITWVSGVPQGGDLPKMKEARGSQRGSLHRPLTEQEKYEATEARKKKLRNPIRWK